MIEKITKFLYENNVKKINEIIDEVNALGINIPQNTASIIQQYINSLVSSVETGTANGTISVTIGNTKTDVAVKGLQSAAYRLEDYFATNSHQHTSNEINKMTGYAKPSVTSAIGINDTLNTAIGKLERALDSKQGSGNYATVSHTHSNYVPTSRKINGKTLESDVTLVASDINAAALAHNHMSADISDLSTTINTAIAGKADSATSLSGYGITDAYTKTEIDGKIASGMHYRGTKASVSALPATGNNIGDMWNVSDTGANYAWNGSAWDKLSETIDLSGYVPTTRTINGKALTGNIALSASDVGAAASNHDQASNTITALTGYSKPSTTSAIAATDALNTALGKLEKALDNKLGSNDTIDKAIADAAGNNIQTTYATKAELNAAQIDTSSVDLSGYAPLSHNQASNTINAMTGYSKASSVAAISASDSLNAAIGKLEKGLDGLSSKVDQSDIGNEAGKIPRYSAEGHLILPNGIELF